MQQDQTPRSLMRSYQTAPKEDPKLLHKNVNAKDSIKGFIQASRQPTTSESQQHQKLINSPQLQRFNAYIEDQVIRLGPSNDATGEGSFLDPTKSPPIPRKPQNEISAFPPMYSASSAPPILATPPTTPTSNQETKQQQNLPSRNPTIFTPAVTSAAPQNTPATQLKSVMMTPPSSSSSHPKFIAYQPPQSATPKAHHDQQQHQSSVSLNEDSTYKAISPASPEGNFTDDVSFEKLLSSPALKGMHVKIVDQVLQLRSPAPEDDSVNRSHASRSLFELSPTPLKPTKGSQEQSSANATPAKSSSDIIHAQSTSAINSVQSTPARKDTVVSGKNTPAANLRPMVIQGTPSSAIRPMMEKQVSDREKNIAELLSKEKEKEKSTKTSPRYSPASPATPSKARRDLSTRRAVSISRIDSIQVKGSPQFAMIDYCLLFFNIIVFFAILATLAILCQVMSAVHQNSVEDMVFWTVSQLTNVQLGDMLFAFGQKYLPFF